MARIERTPKAPHRTPKDLAQAANVSVSAVLKWIREGRIKAVPFGKAHRIPAAEYDRVLHDGVSGDESIRKEVAR